MMGPPLSPPAAHLQRAAAPPQLLKVGPVRSTHLRSSPSLIRVQGDLALHIQTEFSHYVISTFLKWYSLFS